MVDSLHDNVEIIETTDEEGTVHLFERVEELELDGQKYALLIYQGTEDSPPEEGHDEEIVVMRVSKDTDGTDVFEQIEDPEEFERVLSHIESMEEADDDEDDDDDEDATPLTEGHIHGEHCSHE